ncbi:MAG TPA: glycosyl hydrolase, partial [Gemmataceae bacterium]|nr:glycosyl hydrolase [Gemmataceae bacterium]
GKQDVVPELIKLVNDTSVDAIGLNTGAIHALWTLHGLGALKDATNNPAATAAYAALKHPSPGVRLNAAKVLPLTPAQSVQAILDAGLLDDPDPHTRLTALLALADQAASAKAGEAIAAALGKIPAPAGGAAAGGKGGGKKGGGGDENKLLRDAATAAAAKNSQFFLMAVAGMKKTAGSIDATSPIVANHYARGGPVDSIKAVIAKLADAEPAVADPIIRGLVAGWPKGKTPKLDAQFEKDLARLVARNSGSNVAQLATTLGSTKFGKAVAEAAAALLAKVKNESAPSAERVDAARELMAQKAKDKATVKELLDLLTPRTPTEVATGILGALKQSELPETGQMILDQMPTLTPAVRTAGIGVLLTRAEWTKLYLAGVQGGKLQLGELSLDQKQALAAHPNMDIRKTALALLKTGGALPNADREEVIKSMLEVTKTKGDPAAGKLVFTNTCNKCHIHSGVGTGIGPDLTGMAVHTKEHLLVEILDPSRSVEGNFRVYTVVTTKGVILSGLLAGESSTQVELIDAEAKRHVVFRDEIESLTVSTKSLMPDGFEKQLSKKDFTDLLEFLTLRGKFLVVPLEKAATVVTTKGMFYDEGADGERLVFKDWSPKTFDGVPFHFVDPHGDKTPNAIMLYSPQGAIPPKMPKSVNVTVNSTAVKIHLLSGVSGWGYPYAKKTSNTMIVRLHYQDGKTEDHMLKNGEHFADYISKKNDVKGSKFAFDMGNNRQLRYLAIAPKRTDAIIERIEFVKAEDNTAPIVMAMTIEGKD